MRNFGGCHVTEVKFGERVPEFLFKDDQYYYSLVSLNSGDQLEDHRLASATLYCLDITPGAEIILNHKRFELSHADALQLENIPWVLECKAGSVQLLLAGVVKKITDQSSIKLVPADELKKVAKPWGHELWINGEHPGYALKQIYLKAGFKTSLQYHNLKSETNVLFSGQARLHYKSNANVEIDNARAGDIATVEIGSGSIVNVTPKIVHRIEALTDLYLYEVSTPHLDDVIRISDDTKRPDGRIADEHVSLASNS